MPDISMCSSTVCPARKMCYRNEESGTKPTPGRQSYACFYDEIRDKEKCDRFWPAVKEKSNTGT